MIDQKELRRIKVKEAKVNLILDAAIKVFSREGYTNARLEDIAAEAGFSKSALYNYYKEKDELFFAMAARVKNDIMKKVLGDPEQNILNVKSIRDIFASFLTAIIEALGDHLAIFITLDSIQTQKLLADLQCKPILSEIENEYIDSILVIDKWLAEIITYGQKNGEIRSTIDPVKLSSFYGGIIMSMIKDLQNKKSIGKVEDTVNDVMKFLDEGFNFKK